MAKRVLSDLDFASASRITNLLNPASAQEPATRAYVDSAIEGLAWKDSCRVASNGANINLASPGATIDGVTMVSGDRFLAKDQSTNSQNGIYIWNGASSAATRALDADTFNELEQAITPIEEGTAAGAQFRQTAVNGTIGSSAVLWTNFNTAAPAASTGTPGIAALATQAEVDAGAVTNKIITPETLAAWAGRIRKAAASIGDGSATAYVVSHNFNTRDVQVAVFHNSTFDEVFCDVVHTGVNSVTLTFASAPATNAYRVVVIG